MICVSIVSDVGTVPHCRSHSHVACYLYFWLMLSFFDVMIQNVTRADLYMRIYTLTALPCIYKSSWHVNKPVITS